MQLNHQDIPPKKVSSPEKPTMPPREDPTRPDTDAPWEGPKEEPTHPDRDAPWVRPEDPGGPLGPQLPPPIDPFTDQQD